MNTEISPLITNISAQEVLDSRGNFTIKVTVFAGVLEGSFSVPSGASTGTNEAHVLLDEDKKGVKNAIRKINEDMARALIGCDARNQEEIDNIMIRLDGTSNKENLGGNCMIGVSIACAKLASKINNQDLHQYLKTLKEIRPSNTIPYLFVNLINGGKHAGNNLAFQEYHIVPETENLTEAVGMVETTQEALRKIIKEEGEDITFGDEGGFAPKISDIREPLVYLTKAIEENDLQGKVRLSIDVASSSFYQNGNYQIDGQSISKEELMQIYESLIKEFNLFSIEDPFNEDDFESFRKLKEANNGLLVVGDDLTVSNYRLLEKAIQAQSINAIIIKPNQIGTLSETLNTMQLARENNIDIIVSHRSGETNDDFIADLVYAFGCFGLKAGSFMAPERMVKYQRLIKISK